jgi:hypothetical protein
LSLAKRKNNPWQHSAAVVDADGCKSSKINPIIIDYFGRSFAPIIYLTKKVVLNMAPSLA